MVHLDIELVSHPFMSVCEAFLFAMCLQQQYDFFSHLCCLYCRRHDQCLKSVDTIVFFLLPGIYPFSAVNPGCFIRMN